MFVREVFEEVYIGNNSTGGLISKKINGKSDSARNFIQLYESIISVEVEFSDVSSGYIWFWLNMLGKECNEKISLKFIADSGYKNHTYEIETLFKIMALFMERKNGVIAVCPTAYASPETIRKVEKIVEKVSSLTDTVFWFCIRKTTSNEIRSAEKYFDYLGVTEEEWLLLG